MIWIQSLNAPFIQCSAFAISNLWVCANYVCSVSHAPVWLLTKLRSVSIHKNTLGVHDIQGLSPILWSVCVIRPLYCSVASAFAASAVQSC